jgi:hypothetical protein
VAKNAETKVEKGELFIFKASYEEMSFQTLPSPKKRKK